MDYQATADHVISCYAPIQVCYRCNCTAGTYELGHSRSHAHVKERKICLSAPPRGKASLFTLLHEIGHIVAYQADYSSGVPRSLAEYNATEWAKLEMRNNLHMSVPLKITRSYNAYVRNKIARGLRRGLKKVPAKLRHL